MDKQTRNILLCIPAGLLCGWGFSNLGAEGLCKPLLLLGQSLRELSLGGFGGNLLAWLSVLALSALPLLGLLKRSGKNRGADLLLPLASVELLAMLYFLVNPTRLSARLLWMGQTEIRCLWALTSMGAVIATLGAWILLGFLDRMERRAARLLPGLLLLCAYALSFLNSFQGAEELVSELASVKAGNTEEQLHTYAIILKSLCLGIRLIPTFLSAKVLLWAAELARLVETDPFGEDTLIKGKITAVHCKKTAVYTVLCSLAANLLQLFTLPYLADIQIRVYFSLEALVLCSTLFLLCGYFRRAKELHDDNASII